MDTTAAVVQLSQAKTAWLLQVTALLFSVTSFREKKEVKSLFAITNKWTVITFYVFCLFATKEGKYLAFILPSFPFFFFAPSK